MINKSLMCATAATCLVLTSSAVAQANPATPMPVIESAAMQLCGAINVNPSEGGVLEGFEAMFGRGLDDIDGALVMVTAIKKTIARLKVRRAKLFERLTAAVDEVATVYAGLLELSATAHTMGITLDDTEVSAVNDSVTLLQMTFAELEADAAALVVEGVH